jgi:hypothetical protein
MVLTTFAVVTSEPSGAAAPLSVTSSSWSAAIGTDFKSNGVSVGSSVYMCNAFSKLATDTYGNEIRVLNVRILTSYNTYNYIRIPRFLRI